MKFKIKEIVLIGLFAAITSVLSPLAIVNPILPSVPFTLQTFIVFLSAVILGSKCGAFSQITYLLIGALGLPVFAHGQSGIATILGPLGGFLVSFPIAAFIIGLGVENIKKMSIVNLSMAMAAGLVVCYLIGTVWLSIFSKINILVAAKGMLLFIPFDVIKLILAAILGCHVRMALIRAKIITM